MPGFMPQRREAPGSGPSEWPATTPIAWQVRYHKGGAHLLHLAAGLSSRALGPIQLCTAKQPQFPNDKKPMLRARVLAARAAAGPHMCHGPLRAPLYGIMARRSVPSKTMQRRHNLLERVHPPATNRKTAPAVAKRRSNLSTSGMRLQWCASHTPMAAFSRASEAASVDPLVSTVTPQLLAGARFAKVRPSASEMWPA